MPGEIEAVKTEIREALARRLRGDTRPPADVFGVASTAVGEILADLVFAAAQDEQHARGLLKIVGALIERRWRFLASKQEVSANR